MVGSWRLNERHYGALQGKNKKDTESIYGADQVKRWRRSYLESPPKLTSIGSDDRIQQVPTINGESLKDTYLRVIKYYNEIIDPFVPSGKNVLIVAHGNSLRVLLK